MPEASQLPPQYPPQYPPQAPPQYPPKSATMAPIASVPQQASPAMSDDMLLMFADYVSKQEDLPGFIRTHSAIFTSLKQNLRDDTEALHWGVRTGRAELVCMLLAENFLSTPDLRGRHKRTALHVAAECGEEVILQLLLAAGAAVNARDNFGYTALHYAVRHNDEEVGYAMAAELVAAGADVDADGNSWETPLFLASFPVNRERIVGLLAMNGASAEKACHGANSADFVDIRQYRQFCRELERKCGNYRIMMYKKKLRRELGLQ